MYFQANPRILPINVFNQNSEVFNTSKVFIILLLKFKRDMTKIEAENPAQKAGDRGFKSHRVRHIFPIIGDAGIGPVV